MLLLEECTFGGYRAQISMRSVVTVRGEGFCRGQLLGLLALY